MMLKFSLLIISIFGFGLGAWSEDVGVLKTANTLEMLEFDLGGEKGQLFVTVRNDGHILGKPINIELRPQCKGMSRSVAQLEVVDMESACGVDFNSFQWNQERQTLSVKIWDVAQHAGDVPIQTSSSLLGPPCQKVGRKFEFDLSRICR